jgi:Na+-driven multidrug efflux pump
MDEKSDFLGKDNVRKLLFKLSTPIIIGMLVQALY